ncbi:longitudinals lacking protein-like [Rhodnius prolixus]|uniref:longitudinals lacking protein-like n=1 Tax=Rhodnius prolixus TaxID=13249 RepID=UPI003D18B78F
MDKRLLNFQKDDQRLYCEHCGSSFKSFITLKRHKTSSKICGTSQEYDCSYCGYKSKRKDNLERHSVLVHKEYPKAIKYVLYQ